MEPKDVFREYKNMLKERYLQLNVASFTEMYNKLKKGIKDRNKLEKITVIYNEYMSMRDGCEINNRSIEEAIPEMELAIS